MGTQGQVGGRSAPPLINVGYATGGMFWDGRATSLEDQAKGPIQNPIEMSNTHENAVVTLNALSGYRRQFALVFGSSQITIDGVAKAIAAFERVLISGDSAWDRFVKGDQSALSNEARRGWDLFQTKANCVRCHAGFNLTSNQFRNIGVGFDRPNPDPGRYAFTRNENDRGRFETPTLREITFTAPYMHNGSEPTLEAVIEYYDRGGNPNPNLDPDIEPLHLSRQDKADLLALLRSFNGVGWKVRAPIQLPADSDATN
jgi:cytochrome c peroxidase